MIRETSKIGGQGPRVFYQFIESTTDTFYAQYCSLCGGRFGLGTVAVEVFPISHSRTILCGACIDIMHEEKPTDGTAQRVEEITSGSALVDWITDTERPMESL